MTTPPRRHQANKVAPPAVMVAVVAVTAAYGKSASLAAAYGMSVTMTMAIDSLLTSFVTVRWCWHHGLYWPVAPMMALMGGILALDVLLIVACSLKFVEGAWFPLAVGVVLFVLMSTWSRGGDLLLASIQADPLFLRNPAPRAWYGHYMAASFAFPTAIRHVTAVISCSRPSRHCDLPFLGLPQTLNPTAIRPVAPPAKENTHCPQ